MLELYEQGEVKMAKGLEFDPGFAPLILVFEGTVDYLYKDINKFKNLSQKKIKFRQYYKKILEVFYNNLGFYIGCLFWAAYIKTQNEQNILNNHCFGQEYNEDANTYETDFMIRFAELFPKDMKYFLGEDFSFEPYVMKVLNLYREFLCINKGFVDTKINTDIQLPFSWNPKKPEKYKKIVDDIILSSDLSKFNEYKEEFAQ